MAHKDFPTILIDHIDACLLSKLERDMEEIDNHPEFRSREKRLPDKINLLIKLLGEKDLRKYSNISEVLGYLIILYGELKSDGLWNTKKYTEYIEKLNHTFSIIYGITIDRILYQSIFETQLVFDHCIKILHKKITTDGHKRYPSLVEVYYNLLLNVKDYKVIVNPTLTFPLALLLVDDYVITNKLKGLKCCIAVVKCLKSKNFHDGNFYLVIYGNLVKEIPDKDIEVTSLVMECILQLLRLMPSDVKTNKLDTVYGLALEQLLTETSLYRKAVLLRYTRIIIKMHGPKCVDRKSFKEIICNNLDICTDEAVADILLVVVLECLEVWVQNCWFIWRFSTDQKILTTLFKILYTCQEQQLVTRIQNIIVTLINISFKDEQKKIRKCLETTQSFPNKEYHKRLNKIKRDIHV